MAASLKTRHFGRIPETGQSIEAWTLSGKNGLELEVITYGGIVTRILAPDDNGQRADVVLGFADLASYLTGHPYFGAIVGRVAGRITGASFCLDGSTFNLVENEPPNQLHGGAHGFDKKVWTATPMNNSAGEPSLCLAYRSSDGEEGYPGTVDVTVIYTITRDNVFLIESEATTDRATPFSLTHHSYFNLGGETAPSIMDHELVIHADTFIPTDEQMTLCGRVEAVSEQGNGFRRFRSLASALPYLSKNHGDLYVLRKPLPDSVNVQLMPAAKLLHSRSGRILDVSTTETHLQLYTGVALDGSMIGKTGTPYNRHAGMCLECQGYPDGANAPNLGNIILRPGQPRRNVTAYAFSTTKDPGFCRDVSLSCFSQIRSRL